MINVITMLCKRFIFIELRRTQIVRQIAARPWGVSIRRLNFSSVTSRRMHSRTMRWNLCTLSSDLSVTKVSGLPPKSPFCNSLTSLIVFVSTTDSVFCNSISLPLSLSTKKISLSLSIIAKCVLPGKPISLNPIA